MSPWSVQGCSTCTLFAKHINPAPTCSLMPSSWVVVNFSGQSPRSFKCSKGPEQRIWMFFSLNSKNRLTIEPWSSAIKSKFSWKIAIFFWILSSTEWGGVELKGLSLHLRWHCGTCPHFTPHPLQYTKIYCNILWYTALWCNILYNNLYFTRLSFQLILECTKLTLPYSET